jgi:hypothetical protein
MAARVLASRKLFWCFHPHEISIFQAGQVPARLPRQGRHADHRYGWKRRHQDVE